MQRAEKRVPLTCPAAYSAEQDWAPGPWTVAFLHAIASEAEAWLDLLFNMTEPGSRRGGAWPAGAAIHARLRPSM